MLKFSAISSIEPKQPILFTAEISNGVCGFSNNFKVCQSVFGLVFFWLKMFHIKSMLHFSLVKRYHLNEAGCHYSMV
jgi:hypothetical protein